MAQKCGAKGVAIEQIEIGPFGIRSFGKDEIGGVEQAGRFERIERAADRADPLRRPEQPHGSGEGPRPASEILRIGV